jgi:hypothetical protein
MANNTTQLSTLWTPSIWIPGIAEKQATFPALFNSGAVKRTNLLMELASGPGTIANVPFLKDITDQSNEVQVELTAPVNTYGSPGDICLFPILNRVTKNAWSAMAKNVSGADIQNHVWGTLAERRLKQYQTTFIAMIRGLMGTYGAANLATPVNGSGAAMTDVRFGGTIGEVFTENGLAAASSQLMSPDLFIRTKALMGELEDTLQDGCFFVHPDVLAQLEILDVNGFKSLVLPSQLPYTIRTYRGVPIYTSVYLARAGTGNGKVYDSYLIAKGSIGFGEKTQLADIADLASLSYFYDRDLNDDLIWDRTRSAFGVDGTAYIGTPAASSATDAELQLAASWNLKYQTANRVGIAAIRTNG